METGPHTHTQATPRAGYLPTLDGWRAVAILWVIQAHTRPWGRWGISNNWLRDTGGRGVSVFFALSGLLICTLLLREEQRTGAISLASFYVRRIFRIQPAALTYLAVVALAMGIGWIPQGWKGVAGSVLMVRNLWPIHAGTWPTGHFWTLAVEEHFYLLLPGFLVMVRQYRLRIMAGLVVLLEIWRLLVYSHPLLQVNFGSLVAMRTDMAMDGILLGSVAALALQRRRIMAAAQRYLVPWVALLYTALLFAIDSVHQSRMSHTVLLTVYPVLLVATMLHPKAATSQMLEWAPLRFVGRISFSLYLWQQMFFDPNIVPAPGSFQAHMLFCWLATFACATASYYLIEMPLIRRGHKIAKRFDRGAIGV